MNLPMIGAFVAAAALCITATVVPLRVGLKKIQEFEF
jgi:hypothetical protein